MSARHIEHAGFEAARCSGFSMSIAAGYASETNVSYSENLELTRKIVNAVTVPMMADGEDGFGKLYLSAGADMAFVIGLKTHDHEVCILAGGEGFCRRGLRTGLHSGKSPSGPAPLRRPLAVF